MGKITPAASSIPRHIQQWLDALEQPRRELTKWEANFRDSIREQLEEGGWISERQEEVLRGLFDTKG